MANTPIISSLKKPGDVKKLTDIQQRALCRELRFLIEDTVLRVGGHLASNLGVVELTVALHSVFNLPKDKIVWDVGHQCYAHKIMTGRADSFGTLRTKGGISGFPKPTESKYDSFISGHASTSLAVAMGIKEGMDTRGEKGEVIAVIGDGALTGGLAYEAINNLGASGKKVILILNDNEMAISRNQGAVATYLAGIRNKQGYFTAKKVTRESLDKIPLVGSYAKNLITRAKLVLKQALYPITFLEQFGFIYMGPVNGHDLPSLKAVLRQSRLIEGPVIIHVQTQKGHGYLPAEEAPSQFHGVSPSGGEKKSGKTFSDVFSESLCDLAEKDNRISAITAAMADGTGLSKFAQRFGSEGRYFDVGIAESYATAFAAAMGSVGALPVFAVYSTFLQRAYDQLIHDVAISGEHVIFGVDRAGIVGEDGETHQGIFDAAFLSSIPGMTVYSPSNFDRLRDDLNKAVECAGPVAIRYPRGGEPAFPKGFTPGEGDFTHFARKGSGRLIVSYGRIAAEAAEAAAKLPGTALMILDKITPIPAEALICASKYKSVYFIEEGIKSGGIGQQFGSALLENGFSGYYAIKAIEGFVPQGTVNELLGDLGLKSASIRGWITKEPYDETAS